ncbi:MAG: threonine/serine dehydratase, partial [Psychrosphaera sp.]|nr:threonine/serine dehydratase [Psychrosphaera sp.]
QWLTHLLKLTLEPTSALGMAAAIKWLTSQSTPQNVLIVLSGGNMDNHTRQQVWQHDFLMEQPRL